MSDKFDKFISSIEDDNDKMQQLLVAVQVLTQSMIQLLPIQINKKRNHVFSLNHQKASILLN